LLTAPDVLTFDSLSYDFGGQPKSVETLTHEFRFTNTSSRPVRISYAVATCSCTKLSWTNGTVQPGESGFVKALYVRERNADTFEKFISVFVEGRSKPYVLRIAGSFYETDSALSAEFPAVLGPLAFTSSPIDIGDVHSGTQTYDSFWLANLSPKALRVSFKGCSSSIIITPDSLTVAPMSRARFNYVIDVDTLSWGRRVYQAIPVASGKELDPVSFVLTAIQDFSGLSREEKDSGPLPRLLDRSCTFGTVRYGQSAAASFRVQNVSKKPLQIRAIFADTEGVSIDAPSVIAPGETAACNVSIAPSALSRGDNSFKLKFVSNSPLMQVLKVYVNGKVE